MQKLITLFCAVILILFGCVEQNSKNSLTVVERKLLDSIPSGSGIVLKNDTAYIIGDDATGIYILDLNDYKQLKIPIKAFDQTIYREEKSLKRDFESAVIVSWKGTEYLLAFGSGSSSPYRDSVLVARTDNVADNRVIPLHKFYKHLQEITQSDIKAWNIEAATVVGDSLILCNRGIKLIMQFNANDFMAYLFDEQSSLSEIFFQRVQLPMIEEHEARLSGACTLDNDHIIFSASVEDTPDWIKDGPVLGSFIGIYSIREKAVVASYLLKDEKGEILKEKIESLDILDRPGSEGISLIAIADNDNGSSVLYRLKLLIPAGLQVK